MKDHPLYAALKRRHDSFAQNWAEQARTDPEFGGPQFEPNLRLAKTLIRRFGTPALRQHLNETGTGNHPEMLRFVWKVAKELERLERLTKVKTDKDWGKIFYPNFPNV